MGYDIGRAFSDTVYSSLERARDRAAAHPATFSRTPVTSLREAMIRAAQEDREASLRHELGLAGIEADREKARGAQSIDRLDLDRRRAADESLAGYREAEHGRRLAADVDLADYREGSLALRGAADAARAQRFAERGEYERGALGVRQREAAVDEARAAIAADANAIRAAAENVRSMTAAHALLLKARDLATRPSPMTGKPDPERAAVFLPLIREVEAMLMGGNGTGKQMPREVAEHGRSVRAAIAAAAGLGGVDGEDEVDPLLDLGLDDFGDDEDLPPRLGRR